MKNFYFATPQRSSTACHSHYHNPVLYQYVCVPPTEPIRIHHGAQLNLGILFSNGKGVARDIESARLWFTQASRAKNHIAEQALDALDQIRQRYG